MKRLSKHATIIFRYLYKNTDQGFTIAEIYQKLDLLRGDEDEVKKELSSLGLIETKGKERDRPLYRISEYGKRIYES